MKNLNRRDVLRAGLATGMVGALSSVSHGFAPQGPLGKMLLIFFRGGYDAVNTVIPITDPGYTMTNRGPTFIAPATTLSIPGTTQFGLNPALLPMHAGVVMNQRIAFLHAVGNAARSGSHFEDQRTWETAITQCGGTGLDPEEGWVARLGGTLLTGFGTASVSTGQQQFFRSGVGAYVQPHVRRVLDFPGDTVPKYTLGTAKPLLDPKVRGADAASAPPGFGLRKLFGSGSLNALDGLARSAGTAMLDSEQAIAALGTTYPLTPGAKYPFGKTGVPPNDPYALPTQAGLMTNSNAVREFFHQLRDAMWLLRMTSARVVGIEIGSFDTHSNQGSTTGQLANLLEAVAFGLNSVDIEAQADPNIADLTTLVVSEFGRTSMVNSSGGTDHGGATCIWAMGSRVQAALAAHPSSVIIGENGVPTPWPGMFSANDTFFGCSTSQTGNLTYVDIRSDFRAVFGEAVRKILQPNASQMDFIIPNYTATFQVTNREMNYIV